jgi:hypothetical protein
MKQTPEQLLSRLRKLNEFTKKLPIRSRALEATTRQMYAIEDELLEKYHLVADFDPYTQQWSLVKKPG